MPKLSDAGARTFIAACIVIFSLVGIAAIAILAIVEAGKDRANTTRFVFSAVLPLLGTWVGTVLTFYFAQRNFEAARRGGRADDSGHARDDPAKRLHEPRPRIERER